jgi:hypothetical protein
MSQVSLVSAIVRGLNDPRTRAVISAINKFLDNVMRVIVTVRTVNRNADRPSPKSVMAVTGDGGHP